MKTLKKSNQKITKRDIETLKRSISQKRTIYYIKTLERALDFYRQHASINCDYNRFRKLEKMGLLKHVCMGFDADGKTESEVMCYCITDTGRKIITQMG